MPDDARDDADYWGLDWRERVAFHGRLSAYHGRRARYHRERAAYHGRKASRWLLFSMCCWLVYLGIKIYKVVTGG